MDDSLFAFTGVILQVLGVLIMLCDLGVGVAALKAQLKDLPRSSEDEPRQQK